MQSHTMQPWSRPPRSGAESCGAGSCEAGGRKAFTLIELLVVIGIIGVLVAILVPTVAMVRQAAQTTATRAMLTRLSAACDAYSAEHHAFPGPMPNYELYPFATAIPPIYINGTLQINGACTSSENLFLGLSGGLWYDPLQPNPAQFRTTPMPPVGIAQLNGAVTRKIYNPYISIDVKETSAGTRNEFEVDPLAPIAPTGRWGTAAAVSTYDTVVPEYVDKYPSAMPILYMRANRGAPAAFATGTVYVPGAQYQITQVVGTYSKRNANTPATPAPWAIKTTDYLASGYDPGVPGVFSYFGNAATSGTVAQPQQKDGYMLISAGPDRIYGTKDDVVNFRN